MDFHTFWDQETEKNEKWYEIGRMLVPGALNYTKKIRKAGTDIFAGLGAAKP